MKRSLSICALFSVFIFLSCLSFAQGEKKPEALSGEIISAKDNQQIFSLFKAAQGQYLKDAKFNEFCDFAKGLAQKKSSLNPFSLYFSSLTRYDQLKYLEDKQSWDEYFSKGNDYRQDITSGLAEAIKATAEKDPLQVYSKILLWQFHQDQQDTFADGALNDLLAAVKGYADSGQDPAVVRYAADRLQSYDQKGKARELYKLYMDKVINAALKDEELKAMAEGFLKDGNLELAETVYDVYIEKIIKALPKEKAQVELSGIARQFSCKDTGASDPAYAEKVFQRIEGLSGKEALDEQLLYLRAYDLERTRDYAKAKSQYEDLLSRFPKTAYYDRVNYKLGIISVYVLRDIKSARESFQKLAGKEAVSPEVISSLYQLGVLAQWEDDSERAKANYLKLKEKAASDFKASAAMADARLKEIEEGKLLDPAIRDFLDVSLKDEYASFNMTKLELKSSAYDLKKDQEITVTATAYPPESGCTQVTLTYGWAGDFGKTVPSPENPSFTSSYSENGIKVIGLVVRTPAGVIDRAIDMVDVE